MFVLLQFPEDEDYCSTLVLEDECLAESSMFDQSSSRCTWTENPDTPGNFYCHYVEIEMSVQVKSSQLFCMHEGFRILTLVWLVMLAGTGYHYCCGVDSGGDIPDKCSDRFFV
jgi:hypothetical protein